MYISSLEERKFFGDRDDSVMIPLFLQYLAHRYTLNEEIMFWMLVFMLTSIRNYK